MNRKTILALCLITPIVVACGGGGGGGSSAGSNGGAAAAATTQRLCPASIDYSTVYTGGGGDGELVQMQIDTTKLTWQVKFIESAIPAQTGTVTPTRAGTTKSGTLTPETLLPTAALNQCAYYLNGASLDPNKPARIFVGEGILGGTIPGADVQYSGVAGFGVVNNTTFPYYPFIGFSSIDTNLADLAGKYNQLGYHQVPSQNFMPVPVDSAITINADGTWTECDNTGDNAGTCEQAGSNWTQSADGSGAFESDEFQGQARATNAFVRAGKGFIILGKLNNQLVPILIRTGYANPTTFVVDDESGISELAPQTPIAVDSQDGEYTGVDSNFGYVGTAIEGTEATMLDPYEASNASLATALNLDFTETVPGVVTTTLVNASSASGKLIFTGGVLAYLYNENTSSPYFMIGAFVQQPTQ
jgi:hypothetical protein